MLSLLALWGAPAFAADPPSFTPILEVRPRFEAHSGRDGAAGGEQLYVSQRSRLGGSAFVQTPADQRVTATLVVQDVRLWGGELDTLKDATADALDMHEAWLRFVPRKQVRLTVGRQEIAFHEQRLVGDVGWAQQGRSFDALRLGVGGAEGWSMDLVATALAEADSGLWTDDSRAGMVRAGRATEAGLVDLLAVVDQDLAVDRTRATAGLYARGSRGILSGRVEAYGQAGAQGDAAIAAWMVGAVGTVAPEVAGKPQLSLWYDRLSGDADASDDRSGAFQTLWATNHRFYGQLDMAAFTFGGAVDGRGLQDAALKLGLSPAAGLDVSMDAHVFLASAPQGGEEAMLGQELDLWATQKFGPHLGLMAGGAVFLPAEALGGDPDLWGFLQLRAAL